VPCRLGSVNDDCLTRGAHGSNVAIVSDSFALVLVLVLVALLGIERVRAVWRSRRARARMLRARDGERTARELLVRRGFQIVAEQAPGSIVLRVDGADSVHALRADFLVVRDGQRFVAEVKTGALAPSLDHAPTRRQILEYCAAFDVDGALLVDPESDRVREIAVPQRPPRAGWPWLAVGLAVGGLVALLAR
jgi:hypothetical protein